MALSQSDLLRLLESIRTADGVETIRSLCERILRELIEAEATEAIGAAPREHSDQRTTWRNGHRERLLTTQAGDLDLKIPKVRTGSFFPSLLERRRRIDRALSGRRGPSVERAFRVVVQVDIESRGRVFRRYGDGACHRRSVGVPRAGLWIAFGGRGTHGCRGKRDRMDPFSDVPGNRHLQNRPERWKHRVHRSLDGIVICSIDAEGNDFWFVHEGYLAPGSPSAEDWWCECRTLERRHRMS